jgi:hypothetical protein
MDLSIKVIEIEKNIVNNTLSLWSANGDVPIGWDDSLNVQAVEGGNFGYLCKFLGSGSTNSYISQPLTAYGEIIIYANFRGRLFVEILTSAGETHYIRYIESIGEYGLLSLNFNNSATGGTLRLSAMIEPENSDNPGIMDTYLDFISILPSGYPAALPTSYINTSNITSISDLTLAIERDLFSFVSDSISFEIFEDNNTDYTILEDMLQADKLFRIDIIYDNDVKEYKLIFFTDPSLIKKSIRNGISMYSIEAFEISSYFRVNGWFLGTLKSTIDVLTGEITDQQYNFLVSGYNTIEEIIQAGIDEANKFIIAEYIPVGSIAKLVTTTNKTISSSFQCLGRIVDYYYNPIAKTVYILVYNEDNQQNIYEIKFGSLILVDSFSYDFFIRFDRSYAGSNEIMFKKRSILGNNGSYNNNEHLMSLYLPNIIILSYSHVIISPTGEYTHINDGYIEYVPTQITEVIEEFLPQITDGEIVNEDVIQYSFTMIQNVSSLRIIGVDGRPVYDQNFNSSYMDNEYTAVSFLSELIPSGIPNYFLIDTTFIGMLIDLAVIQNAFFYFVYKTSAGAMELVFQTRAYDTATSTLTLDLNNASDYEETYDYVDYSDFETETFKDIVAMKRSLLAYYRNFYGNGLKIIKLTMNELLDISLGDIVTVEGVLYIIRSLETEIGYKDIGSRIEAPKMYLELMEVLFA